jgi:hypothetical protein
MATSCEALAYADFSGIYPLSSDRVFAEKLGYILLDVSGRSVLELLSFCTVTGMWLHMAIQSSPTVILDSPSHTWRFRLLPSLFLVVILLLVISSTTLTVVVFVMYRQDNLETIQNLPLSRAQTLLEASAWGVYSLVVLECLVMTTKRITTLVPSSEWKERLSLLSKAVLPMLVASLVYASRCGWLVSVYLHAVRRGTWAWWIGFVWCPTWIAVSMLLYSARKRDHPIVSEDMQQPLLAPRPPAEAFLAFSLHRQGADIEDSFCQSPLFLVYTPGNGDVEVADEETLSTDSQPASPPTQPH